MSNQQASSTPTLERQFEYRPSGNDYIITYGDQTFATLHRITNAPPSMRDLTHVVQAVVQNLNSIAAQSQGASASSSSQAG